jgi:hypothetical protein
MTGDVRLVELCTRKPTLFAKLCQARAPFEIMPLSVEEKAS